MTKPVLSCLVFVFIFATNTFSQAPANDAVANAIVLTPATTCQLNVNQKTNQTITGSTYVSGATSGTCTNVNARDVWYKFVATHTFHTITLSNLGTSWGTSAVIQLLTNSNPANGSGTWTNFTCINASSLAATGLTVGTTYFIRIHRNSTSSNTGSTWNFDICLLPPPANDNVANAVVLTPATTCQQDVNQKTNQTIAGSSYASGATFGTCTTVTARDVWYKFVATHTWHNIVLSNLGAGWGTTAVIQLLTNSNPVNGSGTWTNFSCLNSTNLAATGFVVGTTYFVRIHRNSTTADAGPDWNFDICLLQPPANDNAANAVVLTPAMTCEPNINQKLNQSIAGATYVSGATSGTCTNTSATDVWYKFVATYSSHNIILNNIGSGWGNNAKIQLLTNSNPANGSGTWTNVTCASATSLAATSLNVGTTYFIRIHRNSTTIQSGTNWNFDICLMTPTVRASSMKEIFKLTKLSAENVLNDPWEVTYGPDGYLWVTEAKGYKVQRIDPVTGTKTQVLDLDVTAPATGNLAIDTLRRNTSTAWPGWPQGGFAGLALHPKFTNPDSAFVYVSYVHRYLFTAAGSAGVFYRNFIVRWKYDGSVLTSPAVICDTLPGSGDHNSQRMIIAPVTKGGPSYLFYAAGDMGSGQFGNRFRPQNAQNPGIYEGKILRFNLVPDTDAGTYNKWIPNDNPYNTQLGKQSAVYSIGMRNNQGFAYDTAKNILYGTSHGPYSDDELNIIKSHRNYGHPIVIGFADDGNYNSMDVTLAGDSTPTAGTHFVDGATSTNPPVINEQNNRDSINTDLVANGQYQDPIFSAYGAPNSTIVSIWKTGTPANNAPSGGWPSEAWSGLGLYSHSIIPGWHKSLIAGSLKWGRLVRLRMAADGQTTVTNTVSDTVLYFGSTNRYRDMAFSPTGKDIFIVMDKSSTTSGPSAQNPVAPACPGCLLKYTFLGYADNAGKSSIPASITIAPGKNNECDSVNAVTIAAANDNDSLWVPLTDTLSNIVAEINAMGQDLGTVTARVYHNANAVRIKSGKKYLDRNITITPQIPPAGNVKIRLYITQAEYSALAASTGSAVSSPGDVKIFKNDDACSPAMAINPEAVTMDFSTEAFGSNGYVLQGTINAFSTFYFGSDELITLPLELVYFKGSLQNNATLLQWETMNENSTSHFAVERSLDGRNFDGIGTVGADNTDGPNKYAYTDHDVTNLPSSVVYYRLKMVDINGQYKYSNVVTIYLADITSITISPNPTTGETKLMINAAADGVVLWKLTDNSGKVVMQNTVHLRRGNNNISINVDALSRGLYFLNVSGAGIGQHVKLQKL